MGHPILWSHANFRDYPSHWSHSPSGLVPQDSSTSVRTRVNPPGLGYPQPWLGSPSSQDWSTPWPGLGCLFQDRLRYGWYGLWDFPKEDFLVFKTLKHCQYLHNNIKWVFFTSNIVCWFQNHVKLFFSCYLIKHHLNEHGVLLWQRCSTSLLITDSQHQNGFLLEDITLIYFCV